MTVPEYTTKFEELARFSALIAPTDEARKNKYMIGLRTDILSWHVKMTCHIIARKIIELTGYVWQMK